jgi:hypothetical protein
VASSYDYATAAGYQRSRPDWVDISQGATTRVDALQLNQFDQAIKDIKSVELDARDFRVTGDGSDDTAAIQTAMQAAVDVKGTLVFPPPSNYYSIRDTITIQAASNGVQTRVNLKSLSPFFSAFRWEGANNKPVFKSYGWKDSYVEQINVQIPTASGVTVWDVDVDASRTSSSFVDFYKCHAYLANGNNNVGWRLGHTGGLNTELSYMDWFNCHADAGDGSGTGQLGWVSDHSNALVFSCVGCGGTYLDKVFTNTATSGASSPQGGDSWFFVGCSGSYNQIDYEFRTAGVYMISGGRWEHGNKALVVNNGSSTIDVSFLGTKWASYAPADNCVFDIATTTYGGGRPANVALRSCEADGQNQTAGFIKFTGHATRPGSLLIDRGFYQSTVDPIYTIPSGLVDVRFDNVQQVNSSFQPTAMFSDPAKIQVFVKAGAPVDSDFAQPRDGLLAVDTSNSKIYARVGGTWKAVTIA